MMSNSANVEKSCALCESRQQITFHHLIPKTCHKNKWFKKKFSRDQMNLMGIDVCRPCHSFLHKQFTEKELGRNLYSLQKILEHKTVLKHIVWAKKQKRAD